MTEIVLLTVVILLLAAGAWYGLARRGNRSVPEILRPGHSLPDFRAFDERGDPVRSTDLIGAPAVIIFVRGNWCPFCSSQVEDLTAHYKDIVDLGARLVFVTPKPLETTRRVAQFFEVEFEFWLDESLEVARELGLVLESGVPDDHRKEYGADTVWPTALVIDAAGIIRYASLSRNLVDRPDPAKLFHQLRRAVDG